MAPFLTVTDKSFDRTSFGNRQVLEAEGTEITHTPLVKWVPIAEGSQPSAHWSVAKLRTDIYRVDLVVHGCRVLGGKVSS